MPLLSSSDSKSQGEIQRSLHSAPVEIRALFSDFEADSLEEEQGNGDDDSGDQEAGDEGTVSTVAVGHVQAGEGGDKKADGDQEEEELQRQSIV
jgi:hypothetical protein